MMKKWTIIFLLMLILQIPLQSSIIRYGAGARALGMGNAFTGFADDISAVYWNPAGIDQLENRTFFAQYDDLKLDRRYQFISLGLPNSLGGTVAFSWQNHWNGMIPQYDAAGTMLGYFESKENTYYFTYGNQITKWMAVGLNLKYRYIEHFEIYQADGFALDLGMLFTLSKKWSCGFNVKDVGSTLRWEGNVTNVVEDVSAHYLAGIAYRPIPEIIFDLDFSKVTHEPTRTRFGVEVWLKNTVALRAGTDDGNLSLGASLKLKKWLIDYAFKKNELEDVSRIAVTVNFDGIGKDISDTFKSKREKVIRDRRRHQAPPKYKDRIKVVAVRPPNTAVVQKSEIILPEGRKIVTKSHVGTIDHRGKIITSTGSPQLSDVEVRRIIPVEQNSPGVIVERVSTKNIARIPNPAGNVIHTRNISVTEDGKVADKYIANASKLLKEKRPNKALEDVMTAIRLDPYQGEAYHLMAKIYIKQGNTDKAIGALKQAIMLSPEEQGYYITLGNLYDKTGQKGKAILEYQKAVEIDSGTRYARMAQRMIRFLSK